MKFIQKQKNTRGYYRLIELERNSGTYDDIKNDKSKSIYTRDEVLGSLLEEQSFLCAYCMQKINIKTATIEHIIGQNYIDNETNGRDYQIDYDNLLAVCNGKSCKEELHCDKSRANYQKLRPLFANPLKKQIIGNIKFTNSGVVYYKQYQSKEEIKDFKDHMKCSEDNNIQYDISYVLNLNCDNLKLQRKVVINALKKITKNWSNKDKIKKLLDEYQSGNRQCTKFYGLIIYILSKKLR